MTKISPLLQNRLNATSSTGAQQTPNNRHEKIYQDLQKKAHEAKPNEAKAKMVNEGIMGNPITATKDTFKDGANFFKAVRTGNMGDNNLGRINDLGLKVGAGLIATYLAAHSKNKTEAIMRFIGGGTFIAAMSLWPKLFINLPARLVHGFRIDRKYTSAQGDKKDFFLDNQFLVWDAYPEEQLRKDAKNAGIDYDSKNGKEKIQRKMQKTALQNRTLWMATAGFATPLMTAMFGNFIEPKVKEAVVKHDYKKAKNAVGNMQSVMENAKGIEVDTKAITTFLDGEGKVDIKELAEKLTPEVGYKFRDVDDLKPVLNQGTYNLAETLQGVYDETATVKVKDLISHIQGKIDEIKKDTTNGADVQLVDGIFAGEDGNSLVVEVPKASKRIKGFEEYLDNLRKIGEDSPITIKNAKDIVGKENLPEDIEIDEAPFKKAVKSYVENVYSKVPSRIKATLDMMNPLVGSKAESMYTLEYEKTMDRFFEALGVGKEDLKALRGAEGDNVIETLSGVVRKAVDIDDLKYNELLEKLLPSENKELNDAVEGLTENLNFELLTSGEVEGLSSDNLKALNNAILGADTNAEGVIGLIKTFIEEQKVNIKTLSLKPRICAEFERALLKGNIELNDDELKLARKIIYDGTISTVTTQASTSDKGVWKEVVGKVFNPDNYEGDIIKREVGILKEAFLKEGKTTGFTSVQNYLKCTSVEGLIKGAATRLGNNKAWMKIFAPMSIALVAVTLLAQPFFGNIKKEFPEENGGAK